MNFKVGDKIVFKKTGYNPPIYTITKIGSDRLFLSWTSCNIESKGSITTSEANLFILVSTTEDEEIII